MKIVNVDPKTYIAFGCVNSHALDPAVLDEMLTNGSHLSGDPDDEPIIRGTRSGVTYESTWIGGALHFFILESPWISVIRPCSPCVPNAHDIQPDDPKIKLLPTEVVHSLTYGYTIPPSWEENQDAKR